MYADTGIYFRDPFVSNDGFDNDQRGTWLPYSQLPDLKKRLTPPPEMNVTPYSSKPGHYQQEHAHRNGDFASDQQTYRTPAASYIPQEVSNAEFGRHGVVMEPSSRTLSPNIQSRSVAGDQPQQYSQERRGSLPNAIAPSFQIPKSVNDSGGSLSELAAQITCLFWFESSDLLQQIEDSIVPLQPTRPLVSDAKPTTGFRKWVTTILSTTLVAQNVVILALLFIYRLKQRNPTVRGKPGSEYRLLTVALMLGNKFLDDNTYTNKTWAEVSGINVNEVHIMEVEFLSNMKYHLFTTADDWTKWQSLLGKFAAFVERATRPQQLNPLAPILPPAASLQLPMALPSPPSSNQASPPYTADFGPNGIANGQTGPTPAPSPQVFMPHSGAISQNPRKRSYDDHSTEPPPKRQASGYQDYQSPHRYASSAQNIANQHIPRLNLPSLSIPPIQASPGNYQQPNAQLQQLPPLNVPSKAIAMVYPPASTYAQAPQVPALAGPSSQPQSHMQSQYASRQQSPYTGSGTCSPSSALPQSATSLYPSVQISPTYFLRQRDSPYRPVHNVSTLLYPPPSAALQHRPQSIEYNQMYYQPLGKPQQRQVGRLPYISQNMYLDGTFPESMTPVAQWPSFMNTRQQQHLIPQQ